MKNLKVLNPLVLMIVLIFLPLFLNGTVFVAPKIINGDIAVSLNEVMASNSSAIQDEDGEFSDWIELYNYGEVAVNLEGYGLSDKASQAFRWVFPAVSIHPKEYMLIWASGKDKTDPTLPLHTNFSIKAEGEEVLITHPSGEEIDYLEPTPMPANISFGRYPNGTGPRFYYEDFSPGEPNPEPETYETLSPPSFSHSGGFYSEAFELTLSHPDPEARIIYTLDGSEPELANLGGTSYLYKNSYPASAGEDFGELLEGSCQSLHYDGFISIQDRSDEPNHLSMFNSIVHTQPDFIPAVPVNKASVVKARAYKADRSISSSSCHSYFILPLGRQQYQLPVVSISTSEDHLFDYYKGIYTAGVDYDGYRLEHPDDDYTQFDPSNWHRRSSKWEYPASFEYFEVEQNQATLRQNISFRINGGASRSYTAKSLRLYAKGDAGQYSFDHKFFDDRDFSSFKRLLLRNGGQGWNRDLMHDGAVQSICSGLNFHTQAYQPAVLFLNSEFWGIHNIRERYDKYLIERVFGADPDNIDYLEDQAEVSEGDDSHFLAMIDYAASNDLSQPTHYQYMLTQLDVDNYIDYIVAQIFTANRDWPIKNIRYWRAKTDFYRPDAEDFLDGRWRWMMHDMDLSFTDLENAGLNSLQALYDSSSFCGALFRALLDAPDFRAKFYTRFLDLAQIHFSAQRMLDIVNSKAYEIESLIPQHSQRWKYPLSLNDWSAYLNGMRDFAFHRPAVALGQLQDFFALGDELRLRLGTNHPEAGIIELNSLRLDAASDSYFSYPFTVQYFQVIPIRLKASPKTGYIFSHWAGDFYDTKPEITILPSGNIDLEAIYLPESQADAQLIHYWHFNDLPSGDLQQVYSDYSLNESGVISYPGEGDGYMDRRSHRAQDPVSNLNLQLGVEPNQGAVLRVRNPSDTRALIIASPSTGFEKLSLAFATTRTSNGAQNQELYYSADSGESWEFLNSYTVPELPDWELKTFDLSEVEETDNNGELRFKILFTGEEAANDSGNNRFDNITLFGKALAPRLTIIEENLDYGVCRIGEQKKLSFKVQNNSELECSAHLIAPEGFLIALSNSENFKELLVHTFAPQSSVKFDLVFSPHNNASYASTLKVVQSGFGQSLHLKLSGYGSRLYSLPFIDAFENQTLKAVALNPAQATGWKINHESWDYGRQSIALFANNSNECAPSHLLYDLDFGEDSIDCRLSFDFESRLSAGFEGSCRLLLTDAAFEPLPAESIQSGTLLYKLPLSQSGKKNYTLDLYKISGQKRLIFSFEGYRISKREEPVIMIDNVCILDPFTQQAKEVVDYYAEFMFKHPNYKDYPRSSVLKLDLDNILVPNGSAVFATLNTRKSRHLVPDAGMHFSISGEHLNGARLTLTNALGFKPKEILYGGKEDPQWQLLSKPESWSIQSLSFDILDNEAYKPGIEFFCPAKQDAHFAYALNFFQLTRTESSGVQVLWQSAFERDLSHYQIICSNANYWQQAQPLSDIIAAMNSPETLDYEFLDAQPISGPTLCYWIWVTSLSGKTYVHGPFYIDLESEDPFESFEPDKNRLLGAMPNPFRAYTNIFYDLSQAANVEIAIYNIRGQLIQKQTVEHSSPGRYFWEFVPQDQNQRKLSSGTYLIRIKTPHFTAAKKMMYMK